MNRTLGTAGVLATALITAGPSAWQFEATPLYSSGVPAITQVPIGTRGSNPAPESSQQVVATEFMLASDSTVTGFTVEAVYLEDDSLVGPLPNDDQFTVALYSDPGGAAPGSILGSPISVVSFSRSDTGVDYTDTRIPPVTYDIYSFSINLPTAVDLSAGTYWVSIMNATPADPDQRWSWAFSSTEPTDPRYASNLAGSQTAVYTFTSNRAMVFTVEGFVIPEPSSLALLMLGAAALGGRRRRA